MKRSRSTGSARWPVGAAPRRPASGRPTSDSRRRLVPELVALVASVVSALAAVVASIVAIRAIDVGQEQAVRSAHQQRLDSGIANLASDSASVRNAGLAMLAQSVIAELDRAGRSDSDADRSDVGAMYLTVVDVFENYITTWRERSASVERGRVGYDVPTDVVNAVRRLTEITGPDVLPVIAELGAVPSLDLSRASLGGVALGGPDFRSFRVFAEGIDLRRSNVASTHWGEANLSRARFECALAPGSSFYGANLSYASMVGADMRNDDLRDANLANADLRAADLRGADLTGASVHGANFAGADIRGAVLDPDVDGAFGVGVPLRSDDELLVELGTSCITRAGYRPGDEVGRGSPADGGSQPPGGRR